MTCRGGVPKVSASLGDLLWANKPVQQREGLAALAQPGGLAALALAKPPQVTAPLRVHAPGFRIKGKGLGFTGAVGIPASYSS